MCKFNTKKSGKEIKSDKFFDHNVRKTITLWEQQIQIQYYAARRNL